jgi:hypothetical protein
MPTDLFAQEQAAIARWKKRAQKAEARVAGLEAELQHARARLGEQCAGPPAYVWGGPRLTKQRAEQIYRRVMRQRTAERARLVPILRVIVQQLDGDQGSTA